MQYSLTEPEIAYGLKELLGGTLLGKYGITMSLQNIPDK